MAPPSWPPAPTTSTRSFTTDSRQRPPLARRRRRDGAGAWTGGPGNRSAAGDEPRLAPHRHVAVAMIDRRRRRTAGVRVEEQLDRLALVLRQVEGHLVPATIARVLVRAVDQVVERFLHAARSDQDPEQHPVARHRPALLEHADRRAQLAVLRHDHAIDEATWPLRVDSAARLTGNRGVDDLERLGIRPLVDRVVELVDQVDDHDFIAAGPQGQPADDQDHDDAHGEQDGTFHGRDYSGVPPRGRLLAALLGRRARLAFDDPLADGLALVVGLLALRQADLELHAAILQVHLQRD